MVCAGYCLVSWSPGSVGINHAAWWVGSINRLDMVLDGSYLKDLVLTTYLLPYAILFNSMGSVELQALGILFLGPGV